MLAWTVASGLSRGVTPLIDAFYPQFTELVSTGDNEGLARQIRIASQLMSVLIIPPAALIVFLSKPILYVWLGNDSVAEGTAPILAVMVVGTVLASCSFPALSVLYSRKRLMPVLALNLICLVIVLPFLILAVVFFGAMGAAFLWGIYGLILYIGHQTYGLRGLPNAGFFASTIRDFVVPCIISFAVAGMAGYWLSTVSGKITFIFLFILALLLGWFAAFLACQDLRKIVMEKWTWKTKPIL